MPRVDRPFGRLGLVSDWDGDFGHSFGEPPTLTRPHYFMPPTSGTASNGLPIFNWDEAAAQLTREGMSWTFTPGPVTVTYAFRSVAPTVMPEATAGFSRFSAAQMTAANIALQLWSDVANITFVRVGSGTSGEGAFSNEATILFGNYSSGAEGAAAFAYLPWPSSTASGDVQGDIWVNVSQTENANPAFGGYGLHTLAHEIGHAIGLSHPGDYNGGEPTYPESADYWQDSRMYTIMSYFGSAGPGGSLNAFAAGPQLHDIAAAQLLYGANMTTRTGDTIYGFNSNTGRQHYTITADGQSPVFAIWDAGGIDTIDLSGYSTACEIDLRELAFSSAGPGNGGVGIANGNISIARGAVIENAIGGSGGDTIIGNSVANVLTGNGGADIISGGDGADTLNGGAGADRLDGGGGDDVVFWDAGDVLASVVGGSGNDLIVFTTGVAPTTFNLGSHGFEGAEGRFTDTGANPWTTRTDYYDSLWRADRTFTVYDNGTRENLDYDQASANTWATYFQRFDSLARVTESVLIYDDNTRDSVNFDAANAFNWTQFYWREDASALRIEAVLIYDAGGRDSNNYDAADNFNWAEFFWKEDALARRQEAVLIYDDGGRDSNNYDAVDAFDWTEFFWKEDSLGRRIESVLIYDDASTDSINYDAVDAFNWDTFFWREDTLGRRTEDILIYDDGSRDAKDYDETNSFTWANIFRHYDPGGTLIQTITTMDDGSIIFG